MATLLSLTADSIQAHERPDDLRLFALARHLARQGRARVRNGGKSRFKDDELEVMANGNVPDGSNVHHKLPLFRGGNNRRSNLSVSDETYHSMNNKLLHCYDGENPYDTGFLADIDGFTPTP